MDKFTDKYVNSYDILKHAVIGFEFEFYCERAYYKLLELFNREFPAEVSGFRRYHSSGKVSPDMFKIEPDYSLGNLGIELITGPLKYNDARIYLLKILKILQGRDFKTTDKCSLHINLSFDKESGKSIMDLNKLKMILNMDEDKVYKYFPGRTNNFYAKSIKNIIPFKSYDFGSSSAEILINSLELPDTKYYGVNFLHIMDHEAGRLEFRYIGDDNYQNHADEILELMDYFIKLTWDCIDVKLTDDDVSELIKYLSNNINRFKSFKKYDDFIAEFPSVTLQVDKTSDNYLLSTYYDQFYDKLYDLVTNIYNLNNCLINYDTDTKRLEVIDTSFKAIFDFNGINFIDCVITSGSFRNCRLIGCDVKSSSLSYCKITESVVFNSKIEDSKALDYTELHECYVDNSEIDCFMYGGVFRSGKLGELAVLDDSVKIITNNNNYFNTKDEDIVKVGTSKDLKNVMSKNKKF